jgi:CRISPR-associated protein Cst2
MSKHLFGLVITPYGTAANNRGESEGNTTTLQKLLWKGEVHTTVSAEAIRWAFRYFWQEKNGYNSVNRRWNKSKEDHDWQDQKWNAWLSEKDDEKKMPTFIDDDLLGFMKAEGGKKEGADKRRGALEVTRAISLSPFEGETFFSTLSEKVKGNKSIHITEVHATQYQYGIALTPESLREKARVIDVVDAIINLAEVAGNHSRFLYDFAPDSVVFRWTDDFAPRFLYGFNMDSESHISFPTVLEKVRSGDISANELFIGGKIVQTLTKEEKEILGIKFNAEGKEELEQKDCASLHDGVKAAANALKAKIKADLKIEGV